MCAFSKLSAVASNMFGTNLKCLLWSDLADSPQKIATSI